MPAANGRLRNAYSSAPVETLHAVAARLRPATAEPVCVGGFKATPSRPFYSGQQHPRCFTPQQLRPG